MANILFPDAKRSVEFEISNSSDITARLSDRFLMDAEFQEIGCGALEETT
jgi:hypothetical protein